MLASLACQLGAVAKNALTDLADMGSTDLGTFMAIVSVFRASQFFH